MQQCSTPCPVLVIPAYEPDNRLVSLTTCLREANFQAIIVVDDGSAEKSQAIFTALEALPGVTVLRHALNLGKGAALKTAINHYLLADSHTHNGIITVDADGQHLAEDVIKVAKSAHADDTALWLGMRNFAHGVPLRSKLGNIITRHIFSFLVGSKIQDTQTGLRFIPNALLKQILPVKANRYEFELEMLLVASQSAFAIREVPIQTIYEDNNKTSHFRPLVDSLKIYFVFLRFLGNSIVTACIDYILFTAHYLLSGNILQSFLVARAFACAFNFSVNKYLVFKSRRHLLRELASYVGLVLLLMSFSYLAVLALTSEFGIHPIAAKALAEGGLFFASFAIQRLFIFTRK